MEWNGNQNSPSQGKPLVVNLQGARGTPPGEEPSGIYFIQGWNKLLFSLFQQTSPKSQC